MKKQLLTTFDYLIMWRLYVVIFKNTPGLVYVCMSCIQQPHFFGEKTWVVSKKCDDGHRRY